MTTLLVDCDRCGSRIEADRTKLTAEAGPLWARRPEIDLCPECSAALQAWLDGKPDDGNPPSIPVRGRAGHKRLETIA